MPLPRTIFPGVLFFLLRTFSKIVRSLSISWQGQYIRSAWLPTVNSARFSFKLAVQFIVQAILCLEACTPALISAGIVPQTIDELLVLLAGQDVSSGCWILSRSDFEDRVKRTHIMLTGSELALAFRVHTFKWSTPGVIGGMLVTSSQYWSGYAHVVFFLIFRFYHSWLCFG
jgi:hypothetical protein